MAGGRGSRMQSALPKQFLMLGDMPILARTINSCSEALPNAEIVVVLPKEHIDYWRNLAARFDVAVHRVVEGGSERFYSVKQGLAALSDEVEYVAVHDGVRALATKRLILRTMLAVEEHDAVVPVIDVVDSYRRVTDTGSVIVDRSKLRIVQTPQAFRAAVLRKAYNVDFSASFTDDASVVEASGVGITLVEGERGNIKLTTPDDISWAEWQLAKDNE